MQRPAAEIERPMRRVHAQRSHCPSPKRPSIRCEPGDEIEVQTADFKAKAAVMDGEPLQEGSRAARELVSLARSASERKLFERTAGALPR